MLDFNRCSKQELEEIKLALQELQDHRGWQLVLQRFRDREYQHLQSLVAEEQPYNCYRLQGRVSEVREMLDAIPEMNREINNLIGVNER